MLGRCWSALVDLATLPLAVVTKPLAALGDWAGDPHDDIAPLHKPDELLSAVKRRLKEAVKEGD